MMKLKKLLLLSVPFIFFIQCGSDEPSTHNLTGTSDSKLQIPGGNYGDVTWDSLNEFVATASGNTVTTNFVGNTVIRGGKNITLNVSVKPRYSLYVEPDRDWGCSVSKLRDKYGMETTSSNGVYLFKTTNASVPSIVAQFKDNKMTSVGVICKPSKASELGSFLAERYLLVDASGNTTSMVHCYGKLKNPSFDYVVTYGIRSNLDIMVLYMPKQESTRGLNDKFREIESALDALQK